MQLLDKAIQGSVFGIEAKVQKQKERPVKTGRRKFSRNRYALGGANSKAESKKIQPVAVFAQTSPRVTIDFQRQHPLLLPTDLLLEDDTQSTLPDILSKYHQLFMALKIFPSTKEAETLPVVRDVPFLGHDDDMTYKTKLGSVAANFVLNRCLMSQVSKLFPASMEGIKSKLHQEIVRRHIAAKKFGEGLAEPIQITVADDSTPLKSGGYSLYELPIDDLVFWVCEPRSGSSEDIKFCVDQAFSKPTPSFLQMVKEKFSTLDRVMFNIRPVKAAEVLNKKDERSVADWIEQQTGEQQESELGSQFAAGLNKDLGGGHQYAVMVDHNRKTIEMINDRPLDTLDENVQLRAFAAQIKALYSQLDKALYSQLDKALYSQLDRNIDEYTLNQFDHKSEPRLKGNIQGCWLSQMFSWCELAKGTSPEAIPARVPDLVFALFYALQQLIDNPGDDALCAQLSDLLVHLQKNDKIALILQASDSADSDSDDSDDDRVEEVKPIFSDLSQQVGRSWVLGLSLAMNVVALLVVGYLMWQSTVDDTCSSQVAESAPPTPP